MMRRNLTIWFFLLLPFLMIGCKAGTAADLLSYDVIEEAAMEAAVGVEAYDVSTKAQIAKGKEAMILSLGKGIQEIASATMTPEDSEIAAQKAMALMRTHLANYDEQEKRRADVYAATVDNLSFIMEVCRKSRDFVMYRSDIDMQWKQYMQAQTRATVKTVPRGD